MMTLEVNTTKANDLLAKLASVLQKSAVEAVKDECRSLSLELIRRTPPKTEKQGQQAIQNDLSKLFTAVDTGFLDRMGSEFGIRSINHWVTMADGRRVNIQWDVIDPMGTGMAEYHQHKRDSRGRVPRFYRKGSQAGVGANLWKAAYVVTKDDFAQYKEIKWRQVGDAKSGWNAGVTVGGGGGRQDRVPQYVLRHGYKFGSVRTQFNNPEKASVEITNRAPGIGNMQFFVNLALKSRQGALASNLRRIIAGIKQDLKT